jgi:drug/metabolite transporter (DMT)-like permease
VVISLLNLSEKQLITDVGFLAYAAPVMLLAAVIMWVILLASGKRVQPRYFKEPRTISLMVLRAMSAYGLILAFSAGGILSISSYISSLNVVIIVLLGAWLLKERDHMKQKLIATGMAVAGLTAILVANLTR